MVKVSLKIKMPFGELVIEGRDSEEIINFLKSLPSGFMEEVEELTASKLASPTKVKLHGIVEFTTEGPIIIAKHPDLTHYEAIGLVIYASEEKMATASKIRKLLEASGIRSMVPARLNEMCKKGLVFKPDPSRHEWKLTVQGERWIEEEVIPKLKGEQI